MLLLLNLIIIKPDVTVIILLNLIIIEPDVIVVFLIDIEPDYIVIIFEPDYY